jgi:hypothetical protein
VKRSRPRGIRGVDPRTVVSAVDHGGLIARSDATFAAVPVCSLSA